MQLVSLFHRLKLARIKLGCKLERIQPQDVLDGYENVNVRVPMVSTHRETATLFDHMFIGSLVWALKPRTCFEIGTSLGLVTSTIAANSPDSTEIHTLDLSDAPRIGSFFRNREESRKIRQHFGPSGEFDYSSLKGRVDLMFIDGSHEFEDVRRDSENAMSILSDKGVILWHDVSPYFPGVIQALQSLPQQREIYLVQGTSCGLFLGRNCRLVRPGDARKRSEMADEDAFGLQPLGAEPIGAR